MLREGAWFYAEVLSNKEYREKIDPDVLTPLDAGAKMGVVEAMQAETFRQTFTARMSGLFEHVDFVATPTCLIEAPKLEDMLNKSEYARQRPLLIRNRRCGTSADFRRSLYPATGSMEGLFQVAFSWPGNITMIKRSLTPGSLSGS